MALVSFVAPAMACEGDGAQVAWPLQSPLAVDVGDAVSVPLAPLSVVETSANFVRVCLDGLAVQVEADQVVLSDGATARIDAARLSAARPDLQFWADQDDVNGFLTGKGTPPAYAELRGDTSGASRDLPLVDVSEVARGRRGIPIGAMLLAIHRDAVAAYADVTEGSGSGTAPVVLVDASLSAAGFSQRFLKRLGQHLRDSDVLLADIRPVMLASDGTLTPRGTTTLAELAGTGVPVQAGGPPVELAKSVVRADLGAIEIAEPADLLVLAGGDVALDGLQADRFADIRVVNVVPELLSELENSAASHAQVIPFSPGAVAQLADLLVEDADFRPPLGERLADFGAVTDAQAAHGFLSAIPFDAEEGMPLIEMPDAATEWVAIKVWTVLNPDVFEISGR